MNTDHYVIIGNGVSANKAADELRQSDPSARITLISDEFFLFYHRHLLPDFITGEKLESDLIVRPTSYYKEHGIRLRLGQRVVRIDMPTQTIYLKHMEKLRYTRLLLCVGGKPRVPEIYYPFRHHFTTMKTMTDARFFKQTLDQINDYLIIGGDLISMRIAIALLKLGKHVVFMIDEDSFWPLQLTPQRSTELAGILTRRGAKVISDGKIQSVSPQNISNFRYLVLTESGQEIRCGLIGAFFGLIPDVDFLVRSGIDIDRGILVNEYLQTSVDSVYAAGDCAQIYNPSIRNYWVSIGWRNAEKLGEIAAHNMLGSRDTATVPPKDVLMCEGFKVETQWWQMFGNFV